MNRKKREQLILDSALKVFSDKGYANTSVSEIIDEAAVARGTFYLYFKSKKDLFAVLLDRLLTDLTRGISLMNLEPDGANSDIIQRFRGSASEFITALSRHKQLAKIVLFDAHGLDAEFNARMQLFYDQAASVIGHHLNGNIQNGLFRNCRTEVVARCIIGSVKEIVCNWVSQDQIELEPTIQALIDYLINGLSPFSMQTLDAGETQTAKSRNQHIGNLH